MAEALIINDRRGQKKEPRAVEPGDQFKEIEAAKDKSSWKDVAYMIAIIQSPNTGMMIMGRAVGLRSDDRTFIADWTLPPLFPEGLDWTANSRKRLDTFLNCECTERGPCASHKVYHPQWMQADVDRLNRQASEPVPVAIENFIKAEEARRNSRIVSPGR